MTTCVDWVLLLCPLCMPGNLPPPHIRKRQQATPPGHPPHKTTPKTGPHQANGPQPTPQTGPPTSPKAPPNTTMGPGQRPKPTHHIHPQPDNSCSSSTARSSRRAITSPAISSICFNTRLRSRLANRSTYIVPKV